LAPDFPAVTEMINDLLHRKERKLHRFAYRFRKIQKALFIGWLKWNLRVSMKIFRKLRKLSIKILEKIEAFFGARIASYF
jgi:hypothetical protein